MSVKVTCPNGHKLRVRQEDAGKEVICPRCKTAVEVPGLQTAAAACRC